MLIKISLDIWRNIFDCLSPKDRRKLALKFDEIGDREFSDIFQKWLHEWIKNVRIGELQIDSLDGKVPRMQRWDQQEPLFPIAQTLPPDDNLQGFRFFDATLIMRRFLRQMQPAIAQLSGGTPQRGCWSPAEVVQFAETECPENIKDFKEIKLRHLDTTVLQFMRHLQPLFRDVCLQVRSYVNNRSAELNNRSAELAALGLLMPLLSGSIHILSLDRQPLLLAIRRQFPAQFLAVKHLDMENQNRITVELIEIFIPWLGTKRADGAPRILTMKPHSFDDRILTLKPLNCADHTLEFIERNRQQFISATEPASFFVCLTHIISPTNTCAPIPESTTQNVITSEQLVVQHRNIRVSTRLLLIGRCSAELDGQQWVEEMREKCQNGWTRMAERAIVIYSLKLGQIEEASLVEGEEEKEDFSQPGPSKKQKLI